VFEIAAELGIKFRRRTSRVMMSSSRMNVFSREPLRRSFQLSKLTDAGSEMGNRDRSLHGQSRDSGK
jgi:hypothetical protein